MASNMQQTLQTCQVLATAVAAQMVDEDKIDPMPAKTTAQLEEIVVALRKTREVLSREALIFSDRADFSTYSDRELVAMTAFVRESSRMLSIVLAGGASHFLQGSGMSTVHELKMMELYIDGKVKEFMRFPSVIDVLELHAKFSNKHKGAQRPQSNLGEISNHPDMLLFEAIDSHKGVSSEESLMRIAEICDIFATQCRTVASSRKAKLEDRICKGRAKTQLLEEVDALMPMLRQHVLRIGLGKSQQQEMEKLTSGGNSAKYAALTSMFTHRAVENAHRAVEDCRERLIQEAMARKVKAERAARRSLSRSGRSPASRSVSPSSTMDRTRGPSTGPLSPSASAQRFAPGQSFSPLQSPASPGGFATETSTTIGLSPAQRGFPGSPGSPGGMSSSRGGYPATAKQPRGREEIPRRDRGDAPGKARGRGTGRGQGGKA